MMILAKSCTDGTCFSTPVRQIPRRRVWEKSKSAHVEIQTIVSWVLGSTTTLADCRNLIGPWYSPDPRLLGNLSKCAIQSLFVVIWHSRQARLLAYHCL